MHVIHLNKIDDNKYASSPILRVLAYFALFDYPLLVEELKNFMPVNISETDLRDELAVLESAHLITKCEDFFSIHIDQSMVARRKAGNERASKLLQEARRIGQFLSGFPFVTGIGISGSLSKNFADEKSDIDFFIITRKNRLWIARTFMHIYKKFTFLTGRQHLYCMNYYIDESELKLQSRNIYTAVETATLLPVAGKGMNMFFASNDWVRDWFYSFPRANQYQTARAHSSWLKQSFEWMFNSDRLDTWLFRITSSRWKHKSSRGKSNASGALMNLEVSKHYSRSNPGNFQEKLLERYEACLREMEQLRRSDSFLPETDDVIIADVPPGPAGTELRLASF